MEDKICELKVRENLKLIEEGKPLTLPLSVLNQSCYFKERYDLMMELKYGKTEDEIIRQKRYNEKSKEKVKENQRKYYQKNKDKIIERNKRYYRENKEKIREGYIKDYQKNKEKIKEKMRKYRERKKKSNIDGSLK